jgi:manganese/zinc/iron transport system permease protein
MLAFAVTGLGKNLPWLLAGAAVSGLVGLGAVLAIRRFSRIKEDAAMGLVLGVLFGAGVVANDFLITGQYGEASGVAAFLEGNPAAMLSRDVWLIAGILLVCLIACALLYKELRLLCFDAEYAAAQGWPVLLLDIALMVLVTLVVISGLQAVGLILVIAMLVIPPASARFWTQRLGVTVLFSGAIGAISGLAGAMLSALAARWPAGASIVLAAACLFVFSMIFGTERGVLSLLARRMRLSRQVADDNLLRSIYELTESVGGQGRVTFAQLLRTRSWTARQLARIVRRARREGLATADNEGVELTAAGLAEARRIVRNHRLWEMYLITHADIAPSHVDRSADMIEHVLGGELVGKLEQQLIGSVVKPIA